MQECAVLQIRIRDFLTGEVLFPQTFLCCRKCCAKEVYGTYMVGKWHLTPAHEVTAAGPYKNWPVNRGFDRYYGFLSGCTDHYVPELCQDNHQHQPELRPGYHLTEDLCDRAIGYLRDHASLRGSSPFYLNLCFGATHAPIQVEKRYVDKYVQVFEKGWDQTREDRLARQKEMGLVPQDTELTERNPGVPLWATLSADQKRLFTRLQAGFAGFLEHTDENIGRVIGELKRLNLFDNTLIMVISDNGAGPEGGADGAVDVNAPYSGHPETVEDQLKRLDDIGGPNGPAHYPRSWAMAGNTPFRRYKQFVELGGVRSPLVVSWPSGIQGQGECRDQFVHVIDLAPTVMDLAGDRRASAFDGASIRKTMNNAAELAPRSVQYWEMFGRRAIYFNGWKAISSHEKGEDYASDEWRLYNTLEDASESRDLASLYPEKLRELQELWWKEAGANSVLPLDDRTIVDIIRFRQPIGLMSNRKITLYPGQEHIPQLSMISCSERSMEAVAQFNIKIVNGTTEGVLLASGTRLGGYSFFIKGGELSFEHIHLGERFRLVGPLPDKFTSCSFCLHVAGDKSARATIFANRKLLGQGNIPLTSCHLSFWGLDVGCDVGESVSEAYEKDFPFPVDLLDRIDLRFFEDASAEEIAAILAAVE